MYEALQEVKKQWLVVLLSVVLPILLRHLWNNRTEVTKTGKTKLTALWYYVSSVISKYSPELTTISLIFAIILVPWPLEKWTFTILLLGSSVGVSLWTQKIMVHRRLEQLKSRQQQDGAITLFVAELLPVFLNSSGSTLTIQTVLLQLLNGLKEGDLPNKTLVDLEKTILDIEVASPSDRFSKCISEISKAPGAKEKYEIFMNFYRR